MSSETQFADAGLAENLLGGDEDFRPAAELVPARQHAALIAFVGMAFEAKIAAGPGVLVFSRNAERELALAVSDAARLGCRGIISFGVAGGLAGGLRTGDWVVASAVVESQVLHATDRAWSSALLGTLGDAVYAPIVGVDTPIAQPAIKRELHRTTGALAVDMESHVVARLATAHGLAFACLRVVVDPAGRAIPSSALMGMGAGTDGHADGLAVLRELLARPSQLPRLVRISLDALVARAEMQRVRALVGPHFGLTNMPAAQPERAGLASEQPAPAQVDATAYRSLA
jgi:adenosylhomocysteine nucleosidase